MEKFFSPTWSSAWLLRSSADIVVIDNLPAHKVLGVEKAIEAVGASLRYQPQYSPDFEPIEMVFHPLKAVLRKVAEPTIAGVCKRIGSFYQDAPNRLM
jgi:transposase